MAEFDLQDFEISDSIVNSYIADQKPDQLLNEHRILQVLKYIFSEITFAGKLNRQEDLRKLAA